MEFKAELLDLNLELITLKEEEAKLVPKMTMNTTNTMKIMNQWTELEKDEDLNPFDLIATELSFIYPKEKKWFLDNFDPSTLGEILTYVAKTLGGIKKREKN